MLSQDGGRWLGEMGCLRIRWKHDENKDETTSLWALLTYKIEQVEDRGGANSGLWVRLEWEYVLSGLRVA